MYLICPEEGGAKATWGGGVAPRKPPDHVHRRQVALATELIFSVTLPCEANDPVNVLDSDESDQ